MPGGSRPPIFQVAAMSSGPQEHIPQLLMSCPVRHREKPSLFLGSERMGASEKLSKNKSSSAALWKTSLLVKQNETGSAISSELVTGQCQGD